MLLKIPAVLDPEQIAQCRARIDAAEWIDGKATAGPQSRQVKHNLQLPEGCAAAREAGARIQDALSGNALFFSAALPLKVFPPLFNRYAGGQAFGNHVDNAVRHLRGTDFRIRSDLSCTLFLTEPDDYQGGELIVADTFGEHSVKLPAGDLALYPSGSLHRVMPVTRGARVCAFFWLQSMVRSDAHRTLLFQMDTELQRLMGLLGQDDPSVIALTGTYHNLLREWADT